MHALCYAYAKRSSFDNVCTAISVRTHVPTVINVPKMRISPWSQDIGGIPGLDSGPARGARAGTGPPAGTPPPGPQGFRK